MRWHSCRLHKTDAALEAIGLQASERGQIWALVAAILFLGNIEFTTTKDNTAALANPDASRRH